MSDFLQFSITGITLGSIYAIVALGFVTIYSVTKIINLAQGEFVMMGGLFMVTFIALDIPYWLALLMAIIVVTIIGWVLEITVFSRVTGADPVNLIILTIGLAIFLRGIASIFWGKDSHRVEAFSSLESVKVFGATINFQSVWIMFIAVVILMILYLLMEKTILGKAFRGTSDNPLAAKLMGISPRKMATLSFVMSGALGAIAGVAIAPIIFPSYDAGIMLGVKGFSAAILGGLGSAPGAVVGGLIIGLIESFGGGYISSGLRDAITFTVILILLLLKPNGIIGEKTIGKGGL